LFLPAQFAQSVDPIGRPRLISRDFGARQSRAGFSTSTSLCKAVPLTNSRMGGGSDGLSMNDGGQVAGTANTFGSVAADAFLWTPTTPNGDSGALHSLNTLSDKITTGQGINAGGQVIGSRGYDAFLWSATTPNGDIGTTILLGGWDGYYAYGQGINASGHVTGESRTTEDTYHAFLQDGTLHDIGTSGGTYSTGYGINDSGQVFGESSTPGDAAYVAFLYTSGGGMMDLNKLIDPLSDWKFKRPENDGQAGEWGGAQPPWLVHDGANLYCCPCSRVDLDRIGDFALRIRPHIPHLSGKIRGELAEAIKRNSRSVPASRPTTEEIGLVAFAISVATLQRDLSTWAAT
jgi:probable HAF family extracellular repeat protein